MKKLLLLLPLLLLLACQGNETVPELQVHDPVGMVDPFIGTGGHGHTFPGATLPFGMVQLSPDTRLDGWDGCSGYHFSDTVIYGFSHTHLSGTGVSDYGDVLIMPFVGAPKLSNGYPEQVEQGYAAHFSKESESASPGYYQVELAAPRIQAELSATAHCGIHRYHFPKGEAAKIVLDLEHRDLLLDAKIEMVNDREIAGYRISKAWAEEQHIYFVARFSHPIFQHEILSPKKNTATKAWFSFENDNQPLVVKVGISAVDIAGARKNLDVEIPGFDFDRVKKEAAEIWGRQLGKMKVKGGSNSQARVFYTSLYHSCIAPNLFSDVDGRYRGTDLEVHQLSKDNRQYTVFSLWDTFRANHPLFSILEQKRSNEFIQTFLRQYQEGGKLPVWELAGNYTGCMIGYHAIPVIVDAYVKGIREFDANLALEAMQNSAESDGLGLRSYKQQGFIGAGEEPESVSKTLEYAYDDWCIGEMAAAMGKQEIADRYFYRAMSYQNLFDEASGFFRARMNGGWQSGFDPAEVNFNFTEANAWQYSCFVPQDLPGLMALHQGPEGFARHLDSLFNAEGETTGREQADITGLIGQYAHGNEPSHHVAYLYAQAGYPVKGQARIRQIMDELYTDAPDGLSGNEDCGQMSAWYVFSAMGFYPVTPGSDQYTIGIPLFPELSLKLENGNEFKITAENLSSESCYIQKVSLNDVSLERLFLFQEEIMAGGELVFYMGKSPEIKWWKKLPSQTVPEVGFVPVPWFISQSQTFTDSLLLEMDCALPEAKIIYTLDGTTPDLEHGITYNGKAILIQNSCQARAIAVKNGFPSKVNHGDYFKIEGGRRLRLQSSYANQYSAGGEEALIDYLRGGANFRTGRWQGYRDDFEAILDLGKPKWVDSIAVGCLQDIKSWIWMPKRVLMEVSMDGQDWQQVCDLVAPVSDRAEGALVRDFASPFVGRKLRYIRIKAEQYGQCPDWHLGAGGKSWIFTDEIVVY